MYLAQLRTRKRQKIFRFFFGTFNFLLLFSGFKIFTLLYVSFLRQVYHIFQSIFELFSKGFAVFIKIPSGSRRKRFSKKVSGRLNRILEPQKTDILPKRCFETPKLCNNAGKRT